jgi:signal transduction histidine kinase
MANSEMNLGQKIARLLARKSLAGTLQLLTGAVIALIIVIFGISYACLSNAISHEDRMGSSTNYGSTLASLLARPISLGDYAPVEQSIRDSALPYFVCGVHVLSSDGKTIASVDNAQAPHCHHSQDLLSLNFPIRTADTLGTGGSRKHGDVVLSVEMDDLRISALRSALAALVGGLSIFFLLLNLNRISVDLALMPLRKSVSAVASSSHLEEALGNDEYAGDPTASAPREIQPLLEKLVSLYRAHAKASGDIRAGQVARQVDHDIRSPLAALEMASSSKNIPEAERVILRLATRRIRDIANDLSGKFREKRIDLTTDEPVSSPQLLPVLIDEIVTEMRLRYRQRGGLEITTNLDASNYGLFAAVDPAKFRRVISNLIQNGVEAIPDGRDGSVIVRSETKDGKALIKITDTGIGVAPEILPLLGTRGTTFGKAKGSGLGLFHAKEMANLWGGTLDIESKLGQGTSTLLTLPSADAPPWFVPKLELEEGSHLVVLDDDESIHQIWDERLSRWTAKGAIHLTHVSSAQEFRQWFAENESIARRAKYLVDFELIGEEETGLSLVKENGVAERAILVTSRYDERDVRSSCDEDQIRLIPKGLAPFVPISVESREICVVLIDDDKLTHDVWQMSAESVGRRILAVADIGAIEGHSIAAGTPIFVDRNLAGNSRGEDVLRLLHAHGFTNLYLTTGDQLTNEEKLKIPFVREVVGKRVPPQVFGHA